MQRDILFEMIHSAPVGLFLYIFQFLFNFIEVVGRHY